MNPQDISWVDVVSPIVTFAMVIVVPLLVALWVIVRTIVDKGEDEEEPGSTSVESSAVE